MIKLQDKPIYRLTMHCRQRFYERIAGLPWKGQSLIDRQIWDHFLSTPENKSWQNNQRLVNYVKERYGSCKMKIWQSKEIMFVASRHETIPNLFYIVTCFKPNEFNSFQT